MSVGLKTYRPLITGTTHAVSTSHYLATAAAYRILEEGGNATDAGIAAGIVINVALPQYTSFGGVAPIIIHDAQKKETRSMCRNEKKRGKRTETRSLRLRTRRHAKR